MRSSCSSCSSCSKGCKGSAARFSLDDTCYSIYVQSWSQPSRSLTGEEELVEGGQHVKLVQQAARGAARDNSYHSLVHTGLAPRDPPVRRSLLEVGSMLSSRSRRQLLFFSRCPSSTTT